MNPIDLSKIIPIPAYFSAEILINGMLRQIKARQESLRGDKILVVTLTTPEGGQMLVRRLDPLGHSGYAAEGVIGEAFKVVIGHISTLVLSCAVAESKDKGKSIGFIQSTANDLPPESEP